MAEHRARRAHAVAESLRDLPLHQRRWGRRAELEAAYDAAHLFVCRHCALPRNHDTAEPRHGVCPYCGRALVAMAQTTRLPPPLEDLGYRAAGRDRLTLRPPSTPTPAGRNANLSDSGGRDRAWPFLTPKRTTTRTTGTLKVLALSRQATAPAHLSVWALDADAPGSPSTKIG